MECVRYLQAPKWVLQKEIFSLFNKSQLQSNKVCYKVSLCENFQRKVVVQPFPYLMIHIYITANNNLST